MGGEAVDVVGKYRLSGRREGRTASDASQFSWRPRERRVKLRRFPPVQRAPGLVPFHDPRLRARTREVEVTCVVCEVANPRKILQTSEGRRRSLRMRGRLEGLLVTGMKNILRNHNLVVVLGR